MDGALIWAMRQPCNAPLAILRSPRSESPHLDIRMCVRDTRGFLWAMDSHSVLVCGTAQMLWGHDLSPLHEFLHGAALQVPVLPTHGLPAREEVVRCQPYSGGGGFGLVWFGSRLAPKVVTHGQCARTSPARLGTLPGCLVSQPPRLLTIPVPRQGADEREIPPCLYV